jgi:uncharacterized membrane protein YfcA
MPPSFRAAAVDRMGGRGHLVMTPLLVVVFGINPVTAIGTNIAYSA